MSISLKIITPEKTAFSDSVDSVTIPGIEGEMGVLPHHAPLISAIKPGELSYTKGAHKEYFAVGDGFVEVTGERVSVITDMAVTDVEVDEKIVSEALERAQQALKEKGTDHNNEEIAAVMASIQKSMAQLHLKRRRHSL